MTTYHEYTGTGTISHFTEVEFTVAIPTSSTDEEAKALMKVAVENAAIYGGNETRLVSLDSFSRGRVLVPEEENG